MSGDDRPLVIRPDSNRPPMVTVMWDGTVEFGPDYTPEAAARVFWGALTP